MEALARLDEVSKSKVFLDAAAHAALTQVEAVKTLAEKPVATLKGVPGGVKRMFRKTKRDVDEGVETAKELVDEDSDAGEGGSDEGSGEDEKGLVSEGAEAATKYGKKYLGVSGAERRWAEKLGVDPYSSNEILIREIKKVAKVDAAGGFLTRLAPIPTIPGVSYVQDVNKLVWRMDPRELRERNVKILAAAGVGQELIVGFFENPWYSPSLQTHLLAAFAQLEGVEGLGTIVRQAAAAESEEEAMFFLEAVRMLARFHTGNAPVERLLAGARLPAARVAGGRLVFLVPVDHISWTEGIATAAEGPFRQAATGLGIESREVWFRGHASPRCRDELTTRGWRVVDGVRLALE